MEEIEVKLELFKAIQNLHDSTHCMTPSSAAKWTNEVYEILTKKNN